MGDGGIVQGPLLATPSKVQAWASKHAAEAPDPSVEIGDDGLPLGVFERHRLSPRKTAGIPTHMQHLDSWRLTELRTFKQQQAQKEREAEERATAADSAGAKLPLTDHASGEQPVNGLPGVATAVGPAAVQLQRKLTAECMIADCAPPRAAESAMQNLFSVQQLPFKKPRKRPSMHNVRCAALPAPIHRHSSGPAFCIPTTADKIQEKSSTVPWHAPAGSCDAGGKGALEENLWAGIGGFGRNGRCRDASSTAALQTPRNRSLRVCAIRWIHSTDFCTSHQNHWHCRRNIPIAARSCTGSFRPLYIKIIATAGVTFTYFSFLSNMPALPCPHCRVSSISHLFILAFWMLGSQNTS